MDSDTPAAALSKKRIYYLKNRKKIIARAAAYYASNREAELVSRRKNYQANKARYQERSKIYNRVNSVKIREYHTVWQRGWRAKNIDHVRSERRKFDRKRISTVVGNLNNRISRAISKSVNDKGGRSWEIIVGYTKEDLRRHIESLFKDGMTWDNRSLWHIDHIIPKSKFNYTSVEDIEFKRCWALENLQPLWAVKNQSKGGRIEKPAQIALGV